jgi:hypothetical protein
VVIDKLKLFWGLVQIIEGGTAHRDGRLQKGDKVDSAAFVAQAEEGGWTSAYGWRCPCGWDQLVAVNGESVENVTHAEAVKLLQKVAGESDRFLHCGWPCG